MRRILIAAILCSQSIAFAAEEQPAQTPSEPAPQELKTSTEIVQPKKQKAVRISAGLYFSGASTFQVDDADGNAKDGSWTVSTGGFFGGDIYSERSQAVFVEAGRILPKSWGWSAGGAVENKRKITGSRIGLFGPSQTFTENQPAVTMGLIYANALCRWEKFYLLFGMNHSLPIVDSSTGGDYALDVKGDIGAQYGMGWAFNDQFSVELMIRRLNMKAHYSTKTEEWNFRELSLTGANTVAKYTF